MICRCAVLYDHRRQELINNFSSVFLQISNSLNDVSLINSLRYSPMAAPALSSGTRTPTLPDAPLRTDHGRTFNTVRSEYVLPADEEEHSRLDLQHNMLKLLIESLYTDSELVRKVLAPGQDTRPKVLDVGGSGPAFTIYSRRR